MLKITIIYYLNKKPLGTIFDHSGPIFDRSHKNCVFTSFWSLLEPLFDHYEIVSNWIKSKLKCKNIEFLFIILIRNNNDSLEISNT